MLESKFQINMTETLMLLSVCDEPSALSHVLEVEDEKGETFLIHLGDVRAERTCLLFPR